MAMIGKMLGVDEAESKDPQEYKEEDTKHRSDFDVDLTDIETDRVNQSYVHEDEDNQEEIDFDQLLGDAAQTQVDYDEDRDDYDFDDTDVDGDDPNSNTFSLSNTDQAVLKQQIGNAISDAAQVEEQKKQNDDREAQMWDYVIEKHGRREF